MALPNRSSQAVMSELLIQNKKLSGISPTGCLELRIHLVSILK